MSIRTRRAAQKAGDKIEDDRRLKGLGLPASSSASPRFLELARPLIGAIELTQHADTFSAWQSLLSRFVERLGDRPINAYLKADLEDLRNWRRGQIHAAPETVNREISRLGQVFQRAVDQGLIVSNPARGILRLPVRKREPRWLTEQEIWLFFQVVGDWRLEFMFLLHTGARLSEAQAVDWHAIDLAAGTVLLRNSKRPKSTAPDWRVVPLSRDLRAALEAIPPRDRHGPLFQRRANWRRAALEACRLAGIPPAGPHAFRHSFCARHVAAGTHPEVLARMTGHSSQRILSVYSHVAPHQQREAVDALDRRLEAAMGNRWANSRLRQEKKTG